MREAPPRDAPGETPIGLGFQAPTSQPRTGFCEARHRRAHGQASPLATGRRAGADAPQGSFARGEAGATTGATVGLGQGRQGVHQSRVIGDALNHCARPLGLRHEQRPGFWGLEPRR